MQQDKLATIIQCAQIGGYSKEAHCSNCGAECFITHFMSPKFFQALGRAKNWKENTFYEVMCCVGEGEEYWFDSSCENEKSDWLKYAINFHQINLEKGMDKAVDYLWELIKKE